MLTYAKKKYRMFLCREIMQILQDKEVKIGCRRYSYKSAGIHLHLTVVVPLAIPEGSTNASFISKCIKQPGDLTRCLCTEMQRNCMCFKEKKKQTSTSVVQRDKSCQQIQAAPLQGFPTRVSLRVQPL